jgi:membrane protein YdbS with pleckstrin-like domain
MTRGLPAVWSSLFGLPFVAVGAYLVALQTRYPLTADQPTVPPTAGVALAVFGLFVAGFGAYVQFVAMPDRPTMRDDEWVVDDRNPAQRSALAKALAGVPFLGAGLSLLYATDHPLVYPTVALAVGLYLLSTGLHQYWRNTLTTYLVTNKRILEEYRFLSLVRTEVPLDKVRAVEERQSAWDALFGLGSVSVRAGASGDLSVTVRSVYDPDEFADVIRDRLGRVDEKQTTSPDEGDPARAADRQQRPETTPADGVVDVGGGGGKLPSDPPTALTGLPGREAEEPSETGENSSD